MREVVTSRERPLAVAVQQHPSVIVEPPQGASLVHHSLEPLDDVEQDGPFLPPLDELFDVGLFESQVAVVIEDPAVTKSLSEKGADPLWISRWPPKTGTTSDQIG